MSDIGQRRAEAETIVNILLVVATLQQTLDLPDDFDSCDPDFTEYFLQLIILLRASGLPNWQSHIGWLGLFSPKMTLLAMDTFSDYLQYLQQTRSVARPLTYNRCQRLGENVWFVIFDHQSDKDFKRNARMFKKTFHSLWEAIRDDKAFHNNSRNPQEHSAYQLYTTLVRLGRRGNGMSHGEVAEKIGIQAGTSFLWTMRTLEAIHRSLGSKNCISWPDPDERKRIHREFGLRSPFRKCVGLIDSTLIEMEYVPGREDKRLWYGRKDTYGFNVFVVADHECRICLIQSGFLASSHDQRVYHNTRMFQEPQDFFSDGEYLLADSGFTPNPNCLPNYKNNAGGRNRLAGAARDHKVFNDHVKKVRVRIEHTIGYWKARFQSNKLLSPQLKSSDHHVLNMSVWIVVTALLHNWVIDHENLEDEEIIDPNDLEEIMREEAVASDRLDQEAVQELTEAERRDNGWRREAVRKQIEDMQARGQNVAYVDPELPLFA
ncbi:hypothetical protein L198_04065 [Cryptococcus wingfieldii CBS 7118]|uniref:DDE Tnp4 domain-containing protein n=1 Tax=Cryptococcus wingfieldii CBS 7118 TaxID=1295528 RepID=A0A1E3J8V3_9TREE|nr:hypothetical protein L198_04065 [Cryptococcus wingfieldii CBS 7118]ODN96351.1 hypothetical protein L198_04065 [Cryptococcus wingfieldii CBS 7118]